MARGDGAAVVRMLGSRSWAADSLQWIGDGLRVALEQHVSGADGLARECAVQLRDRGWDGDDELADALQAHLGEAPDQRLKPLVVDLEELSMALEGDPLQGGGRIDLSTGEVWPQSVLDYAIESGEIEEDDESDDPDRWLWVQCEGSRAGYRDMEWFIAGIENAGIAERLRNAISGRGAFRRFKDTLARGRT